MKRQRLAFGLIVLGVVCSLVGCNEKKDVPAGTFKKFTGAGDSPVVVRGGAMTVRTKDTTNGWQSQNNGYCTGITLATGTLYLNYEGLDKVPTNPTPTPFPTPPKGYVALTGNNWMLTLLGRNFPRTTPAQSNNGIAITPVGSCNGLTGASVYIQLSLTGPNPGFYDSDVEGVAAAVTGKRFRDLTPFVKGGTNCFGPNFNNPSPSFPAGDEDVCERASLVTLSNGGVLTNSGFCTNGECVIGLGNIEN
jgi:hypothetical protein